MANTRKIREGKQVPMILTNIPAEVRRRLKMAAAGEGRSMQEIAAMLFALYLEKGPMLTAVSELYEALKSALVGLEICGADKMGPEAIEFIRAALAKAEGK